VGGDRGERLIEEPDRPSAADGWHNDGENREPLAGSGVVAGG
jgi:hypothetical protein